jgi:hypothetical protein
MRPFIAPALLVALLLGTGTAVPQETKKGPYLTIELIGEEAARIEIKGQLRAEKDSKRPWVAIGDIASFPLNITDKKMRDLATQLNGKTVVVTGMLDLSSTKNRNGGQLLGKQPVIRVLTLKAAGAE